MASLAAKPSAGHDGSRLLLSVLLLASPLAMMAGAMIVSVLEVIRGEFGVSGTAAGFILTTHGLAIALTSPLAGRLIDRYGVRAPLAGGLVLYGLAGGAGLLTASFPALIASRFLLGVGASAVFAGSTAALLALYEGAERDRVMGLRSTTLSAVGVLAPLLAGALGAISWHAPFALYLVGIPLGAAVWAAFPTPPRSRREVAAEGKRRPARGTAALLRMPSLLALYGLIMTSMILMYALAIFLPQRLGEVGVEAPFLVAIYAVGISAVVVGAVGMVYARLRRGLGDRMLLRVAAAGWVVAFLLFGTIDAPLPLLLGPALLGLSNGIFLPTVTVMVDERAPEELRGRAAALIGSAVFTGQFVSPLLLGPLIDATAITTGFLAVAAVAALVLVALVLRPPSPPWTEPAYVLHRA